MTSLGDVARVYSGLALGRRSAVQDGFRLPAVSLKDITDNRLSLADLDFLSFSRPGAVDRYLARQGDVLVSARGTRLKVAVVPPELDGAVVTATLIGIRPGDRILPEVIAAFLRSPAGQRALLARARSSTQQVALTPSDLATVRCPVPSMNDQERIAEFARLADEYRAAADDASRIRDQIITRAIAALITRRRQRSRGGIVG
jgi:type I restriction enzyme M protein